MSARLRGTWEWGAEEKEGDDHQRQKNRKGGARILGEPPTRSLKQQHDRG